MVLLSTAYFPPIQWFAAAASVFSPAGGSARAGIFYMEACENYCKQSYRNRCAFYGSQGRQYLSFPIVHNGASLITDIDIDWSVPWLRQHQRAIDSAYRTSAFFDYYRDGLFALMESRPAKLFDFNLMIIKFFLHKCGLPLEPVLTRGYREVPGGVVDYANTIHPKRPDNILSDLGLDKPYFQVFSPKLGFVPNLSIMDLLFNEGPDSISYLIR